MTKTKINKIVISDVSVVGKDLMTKNILNLSSATNGLVKNIFITLDVIDKTKSLKFMQLANGRVHNIDKTECTLNRKNKTFVAIVVDADDKYKDIKILNTCKIGRMVPVTIVTFKVVTKTKSNKVKQAGYMTNFAHAGHQKSVLESLNARPMSLIAYSSLNSIQICKTNDRNCGSISALIVACKMVNLHYTIRSCYVQYKRGWITQIKLDKDVNFSTTDVSNDSMPEGDANWFYKTGYGSYLLTDQGPKEVIFDVIETKQNYVDIIKDLMKSFLNIIKSLFNDIFYYIINLFKNKHNKSENPNNISTSREDQDVREDEKEENIIKSKSNEATTKIAFTNMNQIIGVASSAIAIAETCLKKNASKDIKTANKHIANMQMNKMMARSGLGGDKTILSRKHNDSFNAYIAGMTSFNTQESVSLANNLSADKYKKERNMLTAILLMIIAVVSVLMNSPILITTSFVMVIIDYFTNVFEGNKLYFAIGMLTSQTITMAVINALALFIEYIIKDNRTATLRSLVYGALSCLVFIV
jgi:hypothetical protein